VALGRQPPAGRGDRHLHPALEQALARREKEGRTTVIVASERQVLAVVGVASTLRPTSLEAVPELPTHRVRTVGLTGDHQATAQAVAGAVGIDDVRGSLPPRTN
jgi:P-type E1-E2 ATPase